MSLCSVKNFRKNKNWQQPAQARVQNRSAVEFSSPYVLPIGFIVCEGRNSVADTGPAMSTAAPPHRSAVTTTTQRLRAGGVLSTTVTAASSIMRLYYSLFLSTSTQFDDDVDCDSSQTNNEIKIV
jgi:hypothetical protein